MDDHKSSESENLNAETRRFYEKTREKQTEMLCSGYYWLRFLENYDDGALVLRVFG
jgi:hypothetical protein